MNSAKVKVMQEEVYDYMIVFGVFLVLIVRLLKLCWNYAWMARPLILRNCVWKLGP